MRIIPKKNYIIAFLVFFLTILLLIISINSYQAYQNNYNRNNFILENLMEVRVNELDSLVIENPDIMVYFASKEQLNHEIRKSLKEMIEKNEDYYDDIVYIDTDNISDSDLDLIVKKFAINSLKDKHIIPDSIAIIKNEEIVNITNLSKKNVKYLNNIIDKKFYGD